VLRARFVRTVGEPDRVYVTRSDGSEAAWSFPTYGDGLPHDLVHLVVESAFGLKAGFWGRVDEGADPRLINAEANRVGGPEKYAAFGADRRELLLAEALAGAFWTVGGVGDDELGQVIRTAWAGASASPPEDLDARIGRVRAALARLSARWRALVPRGSLDLTFRRAQPEASLADWEALG
jgi:hypothetical protein